MMFFKRNKRQIADFVRGFIVQLKKKYPVSMDNAKTRKVSEKRLTRELETVFKQAQVFRDDEKLGFLGKAKLINEIKWGLKDEGYTEAFIELVEEGLTVYLNRKVS